MSKLKTNYLNACEMLKVVYMRVCEYMRKKKYLTIKFFYLIYILKMN